MARVPRVGVARRGVPRPQETGRGDAGPGRRTMLPRNNVRSPFRSRSSVLYAMSYVGPRRTCDFDARKAVGRPRPGPCRWLGRRVRRVPH